MLDFCGTATFAVSQGVRTAGRSHDGPPHFSSDLWSSEPKSLIGVDRGGNQGERRSFRQDLLEEMGGRGRGIGRGGCEEEE
jgi:hypothetical protein